MNRRTGLPRLHLVTSDAVLTTAGFLDRAQALLERHGAAVAVHVRGHGLGGARLLAIARALAAAAPAMLLVNDRLDVALAAGARAGAQIGARSLPVCAARALLAGRWLGYSAHAAQEAQDAMADGADFVVLGTIFATASHPGRPAAGVSLVRQAASVAPVLAIGGVTPERVRACLAAGAHGVAVLGGVWNRDDPADAAAAYLAALSDAAAAGATDAAPGPEGPDGHDGPGGQAGPGGQDGPGGQHGPGGHDGPGGQGWQDGRAGG